MGNLPLIVMNASVFGSTVLAYIAPGWTAAEFSDTTWGHGLMYGFVKYSGNDDEFSYSYVQASGAVEFGDETIVDVSSTPWIAMPIFGMVAVFLAFIQIFLSCNSSKGLGIVKFTNFMIIALAISIMIVYVYTDYYIEMKDRCDDPPVGFTCDSGTITWTFNNVLGTNEVVMYKFWWSYFFGCVAIFFSLMSMCLAAQYQKA